jgi:uncharacterized protein (TIGR02246 family)
MGQFDTSSAGSHTRRPADRRACVGRWFRIPVVALAAVVASTVALTTACADETAPSSSEADIRQRVDRLAQAIRAMDLEGVMSTYAPDMVAFDVEPPLEHVGAEAKRKNWVGVFATYQRPLGYEIRDLTITVGGDVAFAHSLNRISGTLKNGNRTGMWLRATTCWRKIDGDWLITHDHASVPFDPGTGRAFVNLEP